MQPSWSDLLKQVNALLTPAKEIVVVIRPNPNLDAVAAGLSISQALRKIGRQASVICPTKLTTGFEKLKGVGEILTDFPQKKLTVTLNYQQGSFGQGEIQKTEKGLQVNLASQAGQPIIEPLNIDYKEHQSRPDTIILVEIENLAHLQDFYQKNRSLFDTIPSINIDYHPNNARYGKVNLIDPKASSISEMTALMLYDLRVAMDETIADNLYQGLADRTQSFASNYHTANLLESASICMRYKAAAQQPQTSIQPRTQSQAGTPMGQPTPSQPAPQVKTNTQPTNQSSNPQLASPAAPTTPPTPSWPQTNTGGWK